VTSLPWTAAQIMPDIFTPMMVLAFALLVLEADLSNVEIRVLAGIVTLALMVHLSNLPIYAGLCLTVLALRVLRRGWVRWRALLLPVVIGTAALIGVNLIASGRLSPSPYGATFILARLLGDGPARVVLARDCAARGWALCAYRHEIPHTADAFLWRAGSPLYRAGGPVRLIGQTKAIVTATLAAEPGWVARDGGAGFSAPDDDVRARERPAAVVCHGVADDRARYGATRRARVHRKPAGAWQAESSGLADVGGAGACGDRDGADRGGCARFSRGGVLRCWVVARDLRAGRPAGCVGLDRRPCADRQCCSHRRAFRTA
jgi:hypothetical protein